ncbi:MAG: hypothetical protein WBE44_08935, partial [Terriglobales bacterium]
SIHYAQDDRMKRETEKPPPSTGCPTSRAFRDVGATSTHKSNRVGGHSCPPQLRLVWTFRPHH